MEIDWRNNKFSCAGIVCGLFGMGVVPVATLALALGWWGRKRGETMWWWALAAGLVGLVVGAWVTAAFNVIGT